MKALRVVVLGGAGFFGSHLCERLVRDGHHVVALDDFSTGSRSNVSKLVGQQRLTLSKRDVRQPLELPGPFTNRSGSPRWARRALERKSSRTLGCGVRPSVERTHWYRLFDLPRAWPATTRHEEAEGSSYYRHFYMGLIREDGTPKLALRRFREFAPQLGLCQWLHFEGHRLEATVRWLEELGVRHLRMRLSSGGQPPPGATPGSIGR